MSGLLRWLWAMLRTVRDPEARQHPDGGPGPYSGPYPWEKDGEALATPHPRHEAHRVWGFDPAAVDGGPGAVVGARIEDGVLVIDNVVTPLERHRPFAEALAAGFQQVAPDAEQVGERRPVDPTQPLPASAQLLPGDPGYWEQFG